ncbi:RNA polymerase sigma factor [Mycobacterium marinum]|uniref:RNA polymerase sigma factor n=1 Tax=Mycobacterium marinum TaxID=1781 RepID=UPI000B968D8B|nr:RNA polymerase sigma factor [Mycobacterium marinum]MDC8984854.1 RNA polymerase sigma factor [Mycobacterium marinum]MDC8994888.1 RNA polymerase sigma factor [Mycobacterium marinum]MDC9000486.1 RNA polymerase sigma factor [Mycobacterium marinum]MDC9012833.1 RNA polymerase sigma factor [Mycobacterium marinum]MDC9018828.1 RNA polymerase sigma factor [Mycobacterium marinum]
MAVPKRTIVDDRWATESDLIAALQAGDGHAFRALVETLHAPLVRLASIYVSRATAEDAVQNAWVSAVRSIGKFEGRASVRTWMFRVVLNQVHTLARKEANTVPFATAGPEVDPRPSVDPERLIDPELGPNHWRDVPVRWDLLPEQRLLSAEVRSVVVEALQKLPGAQREVVAMRDLEGWSSEETCEALGISAVNQRVLLHRGRTALRAILEEYFHDH